jgi:hypothetical protein
MPVNRNFIDHLLTFFLFPKATPLEIWEIINRLNFL